MSEDVVYADVKLARKNVSPSAPSPSQDLRPSSKYHRTLLKVAYAVIVILFVVVIALSALVFKRINSMECSKAEAGSPNGSTSCAGTRPDKNAPSTVVPTQRTCPDDWKLHQGKCYWFSNGIGNKSWKDSKAYCEEKSNLTVIWDTCDLGFIWSKISQSHKYWIRLPIQNPRDNWTWPEGSDLNWSLFQEKQVVKQLGKNSPSDKNNEEQENENREKDKAPKPRNKEKEEKKHGKNNPRYKRNKEQEDKSGKRSTLSYKKKQCPVLSRDGIYLDSCNSKNFWICQQ
ncbi:killer cell lectin-like receptor subfamily B member 1B allele C [Tachyglossus aculeatus]|uniref:killer cell lectin-like receptor subfamily B member 1B allele C n=1 Tax=Tachyglossus aculeatus TaxID=9261 RepID=UPI0018F6F39B|nr:killer cell lectin-like receptor subfamily B member 1B allele C [Tachyglossus aculeatus]